MNCIFCKISEKEINAHIIYEDEHVVVFDDLNPQAPHHKLIISRKHIDTLNHVENEDTLLLGHMIKVASDIAKKLDIADSGYRVLMNCNSGGGQSVFHIHAHLLGGRQMTWPPG